MHLLLMLLITSRVELLAQCPLGQAPGLDPDKFWLFNLQLSARLATLTVSMSGSSYSRFGQACHAHHQYTHSTPKLLSERLRVELIVKCIWHLLLHDAYSGLCHLFLSAPEKCEF